jgi:hypothetical protein
LKKIFYSTWFQALCFTLLMFTVYRCSDDNNNTIIVSGPDAKSISGTITFADTNFATSGGYYDISAFPSSGWPPMAGPTQNDSLVITKVGNQYKANYKLTNLPDGNYVLTSAWIILPYTANSTVGLGMYGCDTSHSAGCIFGTPGTVTISNSVGVENINFLSWADTLNRIY